jgi:two-component system sensor histidine kinase MprB
VRARVLTFHRAAGGAAQVAQPLTDVDNALSSLVGLLLFISAGGVSLAALAAWLISARVVEPITELEGAAGRIEQTGDLDERVAVKSSDEVGRLAERFNAMLDRLRGSQQALESSLEAQRQFVADASHELRTPVTSIRTNAELLAENPEIDPQERTAMANDIADQAAEMTAMMTALIELARGDTGLEQAGTVKLADVVRREVDRLHAQHPGIEFDLRLDESQIAAHPGLVGRVVGNLLDNAAKFSPAGGSVTVALSGGKLTITDHGPGIDAEDLPHVFDRFYRGGRARALPGSGLGLAIVKQVVDAHGGTIEISSPPDAGTTVTLRMPAPPPSGAGGAESTR